ncbi:hypothetical protein AB0I81_50985 [Nonomuraea sp. NPDC050404]|uniref:hypothetical protein n=1 Tax=Nonomuraea sp. NPDC050404 TaxID=3155783 RepID=UPI0033EE4BFB
MSPLLERIAARRTELTEQAQHLTKQLTDVQHELDRVSVAEQVITQMLAEPEPEAVGRDMPAPATSTATCASTSSGSAIIPYRHQVSGADELPADYQLERIRRSVAEHPDDAVGAAKQLIEATAKIVLKERGEPVSGGPR